MVEGDSSADDPGGGLKPENPDYMDTFKDKTFMMILKGKNDILKNTRPRVIYKILPKTVNFIKCIPLKSGDYLIKINASEKNMISNIQNLVDDENNMNIPVEFLDAGNMNCTKVTIWFEDLRNSNDEELTSDLKDQNQNILDAKIETSFKNGVKSNTPLAVVTLSGQFSELELKSMKLNLNFYKLPVKLYIPPPLR